MLPASRRYVPPAAASSSLTAGRHGRPTAQQRAWGARRPRSRPCHPGAARASGDKKALPSSSRHPSKDYSAAGRSRRARRWPGVVRGGWWLVVFSFLRCRCLLLRAHSCPLTRRCCSEGDLPELPDAHRRPAARAHAPALLPLHLLPAAPAADVAARRSVWRRRLLVARGAALLLRVSAGHRPPSACAAHEQRPT